MGGESGGGETRGSLTSVVQVEDGQTRVVAVVGGAFCENCLFTSFAHFLLDSCLCIDLPEFSILSWILCVISLEISSDSDVMK